MSTKRSASPNAAVSSTEPVEEFSLPADSVVEGYYTNHGGDGLRYPYGRSLEGGWAADEFGWAAWNTVEERDRAIQLRRSQSEEPELSGLGKPVEAPACVLRLIELARAAWDGDTDAGQQLRLAGELLEMAGGAKALCDVQGLAHDHVLKHDGAGGRDLAGHMGSYWEHIASWAAL